MKNTVIASLVAAGAWLALGVALDAQPRVGIQQVDRPLIGRYIVVLRDAHDALAVGAATANLTGGRLRHVYDTAINGFAIDLSEGVALALAADPRVEYVEQDGVLTLAAAAAQGVPSWGLDRINQRTLPLDANYLFSRDGTGVNVHILDTGIRVTHAEFGGRAFIGGDYVSDGGSANDCHGHGTHIAGTIGGATYGVAKNVTLWAHRVLDCGGSGATSALIAAVDAITRDTMHRPAVANISLAAPASIALDEAIGRSISAGITYVVAAGNGDVDSGGLSPARIAEAITVGATTARDRRASFSNRGAIIDLFAPGDAIVSAATSNDTAIATMSGTSTASAHVAGVAALLLGEQRDMPPSAVHSAVVDSATRDVLTHLGAGSPNRLLYSEPHERHADVASVTDPADSIAAGTVAGPYVTLTSPDDGENWGVGSRQQIAWQHNLGSRTSVRIELSRDGGATWTVLASSVKSNVSSGEFSWTVTGPATTSALLRVSWTGGSAVGVSAAPFTIAAPFVRIASPNGGETWASGSIATVVWTDNLGPNDEVAIRLSQDGGGSYPTLLARMKSVGSYDVAVQSSWLTTSAKVRVTWTKNSGVTDTSDGNFQIADASAGNESPSASLTAPGGGASFTAPATITVSANASDTDGTIARVDFYQGATLIGSDTTSPFSITWSSVPPGSFTLTAVATDDDGATTTSAARSITVEAATTTKRVVFGPSPDHSTLVHSYLFEVFAVGADTSTATPVAAQGLGRPAKVNGECTVDVTAVLGALPAGTYQATVAAVGAGGKSRSAPFSFTLPGN